MGNLNSKAERDFVSVHNVDAKFNPSELSTLRRTWDRAKMSKPIGEDILLTLIDRRPTFVAYFGFHELQNSALLSSHLQVQLISQKIESLLDETVAGLGNVPEDKVWQVPYAAGVVHFYKGVNLRKEDWKEIEVVVLDKILFGHKDAGRSLCRSHRNASVSEEMVWKKFIACVLCEMKRGFMDEAKRNCA